MNGLRRSDIYLVDLEPTRGREQQGRRPVLIVSPDEFNAITGLPIILPITSGGAFAVRNGHAVNLEPSDLQTSGIVRCDQPRVLDLLDRRGRFLERVPSLILAQALAKMRTLFL